eukprot:g19788.t1
MSLRVEDDPDKADKALKDLLHYYPEAARARASDGRGGLWWAWEYTEAFALAALIMHDAGSLSTQEDNHNSRKKPHDLCTEERLCSQDFLARAVWPLISPVEVEGWSMSLRVEDDPDKADKALKDLLHYYPKAALARASDGRGGLWWAWEYREAFALAALIMHGAGSLSTQEDNHNSRKKPHDLCTEERYCSQDFLAQAVWPLISPVEVKGWSMSLWEKDDPGKADKALKDLLHYYPKAALARASDGRGGLWWAWEYHNAFALVREMCTGDQWHQINHVDCSHLLTEALWQLVAKKASRESTSEDPSRTDALLETYLEKYQDQAKARDIHKQGGLWWAWEYHNPFALVVLMAYGAKTLTHEEDDHGKTPRQMCKVEKDCRQLLMSALRLLVIPKEQTVKRTGLAARSGGKRGKLRTSRTKDRESDKLQADFIRVVEAHSDSELAAPSGDKRLSRLPGTVQGLSRTKPQLFLVAFASNANEGEGVVQKGLKDKGDLYPEAKLEQVAMKTVDDALALGNGDPLERAKKLYSEHAAAWAELWEGGVEVAGAGEVATKSEKTTMFSMYYLLSSCRHDVSWSTSPGGLSTNGYGGHVFWDTEVWMYPGMLLFFPDVVKTGMLQYRLKTLEGAQHRSATNWKKGPLCENGKSHSSCETEGARFAWEAALTGIEAGVGNAGTVTNEVHVTGGVAFAADLFYRAHRGTRRGVDFMFQHGSTSSRASSSNGYEALLKETANFWSSYVTWEGEKARLLKVIPPDQEAGYVDDSIATNAMAQRNLEAALRWNPEVHDATKSPVAASVDYELKDDAHVEYVGFNWQKKVKQADTVLLGFPLDRISLMPHQENTFRNDLLFAERAYNPDAPCMTHSAQMTGWLTLKMVRKAFTCLEKAHANAHGAFRIWTEYPTGGVTHFLTGMGGFLQTMTYGMAGLRLHPDGMALSPNLVDGMRRYALRGVWFLGCVLRLEWEAPGEWDSAEEVKFFVSVARCMGEEDQLHGRFPIVARWHQVVAGTGDSEDDELQLRKMEHRFDSAARMNVKFQPDFGSFRRFDKKGFPSLLLQHEKDRDRWPSVDGPLENKKTCGTAREGKDYDGSPEGYVVSAWIKKEGTAEECRAACEEAAECEAYTLGHSDGNCMFKRKKENGFKDNKQCESGECTFKKRKIKYTT